MAEQTDGSRPDMFVASKQDFTPVPSRVDIVGAGEQKKGMAAPTIDELTERLLQVEALDILKKFGISEATIQRVSTFAKELQQLPNTQYQEKLKRLKTAVDGLINEKSTFDAQTMVHDMVMVDSQQGFVTVNNFGGHNSIDKDASDDVLLTNPENTGEAKIHVQVPDDLVPMIGPLLMVALKDHALNDYSAGKDKTDVAVSSKIFSGYRSIPRADVSRIVFYMNGQFAEGNDTGINCFRATADIIAPLMEVMNIGGLVNNAQTENDVKPPSYNAPLKHDGKEVPNTYFAFGHSFLRNELAKRGLLDKVYDPQHNSAIPRALTTQMQEYL